MSKFSLPEMKDKKAEPSKIDIDALTAFASGAKEKSTTLEETQPWLKYDKEDTLRYNVTIRMNDYYIEILRHLTKKQEISQHKVLAKILFPELEKTVSEE